MCVVCDCKFKCLNVFFVGLCCFMFVISCLYYACCVCVVCFVCDVSTVFCVRCVL